MGAVVSAVLLAVAKELAQTAKDSLPELRDGEQVLRESAEASALRHLGVSQKP